MSKKTLRNAAYYEERLKRDHPKIYADFKAGKYPTVNDAAVAAGLRKKRTRLHEMKNAWTKASDSEKNDFLLWVGQQGVGTVITPATITKSPPQNISPFDADGFIQPWAKARIDDIKRIRGINVRKIRDEIGIDSFDTSLDSALKRSGSRIKKQATIDGLAKWLAANASV